MRWPMLLCPCIVVSATAGLPHATIELQPQARVTGPTVVLGEVALLRSDDLTLLRRLVQLPIGSAPHPGDAAVLQRDALGAWLRRQAGVQAEQIEWRGVPQTSVARVRPQVSGDVIARAAVDAARSRGMAVQVRFTPRDVDVPPGNVRVEARGLEQPVLRGRIVAWVDVWAANAFVRTVPVALEVGHPDAQTVEESPPNSPVRAADAERLPTAVVRGEWATLRSVEGAISLESKVEVLQDGRPGQRIRVRSRGASAPVFARVLGRGQLELVP